MGYTGGDTEWPTYRSIQDHTEATQIIFDPTKITYDELLAKFFNSHDATRAAYGTQYMSGLWFQPGTDQQQRIAATVARMEAGGELGSGDRTVQTVIGKLKPFYLAEGYHQKYRDRDLLDGDEWLKEQIYGKVEPKM